MAKLTKDDLLDLLDEFTQAYIECALWSSMDNSDESGGEPLDNNYGIDDFTMASLISIKRDCVEFQATEGHVLKFLYASKHRYTATQAGHDFWLTRNHHGAGFWDRGLGAIGQALTAAAQAYGSCDIAVGNNKKLYVE